MSDSYNAARAVTVTIELSEEQAARLRSSADAEGITVSDLVQRLAEQQSSNGTHAEGQAPVAADDQPIWEMIAENMRDVPDEDLKKLPKDGASQIDHYLYGHPKR